MTKDTKDFKPDNATALNHRPESSRSNNEQQHNFLDVKETKTRLRPHPTPRPWSRVISDDELINENSRPNSSRQRRRRESPRRKKRRETTQLDNIRDSYDSHSDVPLRPRKLVSKNRPRLTPATTHTSSTSHTRLPSSASVSEPIRASGRAPKPTIIILDSDSEDVDLIQPRRSHNHQSNPTRNPSTSFSAIKDEAQPINIKGEPLSLEILTKTILRVTASNETDKAPISVSLNLCRTSDQLFTTLVNERGVRLEAAKKVSVISATYTWSGKRHGIRRGKVEDWTRFCRALQRAWDSEEGNGFRMNECEVDMIMHVDD